VLPFIKTRQLLRNILNLSHTIKALKKKQNRLKLLSFTLIFVVFSAISALSFFPVLDLLDELSDDSLIHQTLPLDSKSSNENQTLEEESLEEEADQFISDFTLSSLRYDCKSNHRGESFLLINSGLNDIHIPPPKNI